jgi:hypothetical protein
MPVGIGSPRPTKPPLVLVSGQHQAFPGVTRDPDGTLWAVWRSGSDHYAARDGVIKASTSADQGRTWTPATTIVGPASGVDYRDPSITASRDGGRLWLTYFKGTSTLNAAGVFVRSSSDGGASWGAETRVDGLAYAAVTAPVVELPDGTLKLPYYGKANTGLARDSVWIATSSDGGASWTNAILFNGVSDGHDYQEPVIAADPASDSALVLMCRWGNAYAIAASWSYDNGHSWDGIATVFGGSGRPTPLFLDDALVVLYREIPTRASTARVSRDGGQTWAGAVRLAWPGGAGALSTYTAALPAGPGQALLLQSDEVVAGATSALNVRYLTLGGAATPLGTTPSDVEAAVNDYDDIIWADRFRAPEGPLPAPWQVVNGGLSISGGEVGGDGDGTPDRAVIDTGVSDVAVELDFNWSLNSRQLGMGIVLRYVDARNFIMATFESIVNGGSPAGYPGAFNLYRYLNGTLYRWANGAWTTSLSTPTAQMGAGGLPALFANSWHRLRVEARGAAIETAIDGVPMMWANDQADASTVIGSATKHGFQINPAGGYSQSVRRFVVKS